MSLSHQQGFAQYRNYLSVDLAAIEHNGQIARNTFREQKLMCVLKADAYGHGIRGVLPAYESFADAYAVATVEEGLEIRQGSEKPVLLDFWAAWCGPCRMIAPVLDELAEENPDVKIVKVNVDENPELANQFQVMSIPALFVIKEGEVVAQSLGVKPKAQLQALIDQV